MHPCTSWRCSSCKSWITSLTTFPLPVLNYSATEKRGHGVGVRFNELPNGTDWSGAGDRAAASQASASPASMSTLDPGPKAEKRHCFYARQPGGELPLSRQQTARLGKARSLRSSCPAHHSVTSERPRCPWFVVPAAGSPGKILTEIYWVHGQVNVPVSSLPPGFPPGKPGCPHGNPGFLLSLKAPSEHAPGLNQTET